MKMSPVSIAAVVVVLGLSSAALAQRGVGDARGVAQQPNKPNVVALSGKVLKVETAPCEMTTGRSLLGTHFIMKTSDAGATWEVRPVPFSIRSLQFASRDSGWAVGPVEVLRSIDGGESWTIHDCGPFGWIGNLLFLDTLNGWVSGGGGFMTATRDGGVTWEAQSSGTTRNIVEHFFLDGNTGWYVARSPGVIAATTDGGSSWRFQTVPGEGVPSDIAFADADTGWVCGQEGLILKTVTGGW